MLLSIAITAAVCIVFEIVAFALMCALVAKNNVPLHLSTVGGVVSIVVMGGMLIWFSVLANEVDSDDEYYDSIDSFIIYSWTVYGFYFVAFFCCI